MKKMVAIYCVFISTVIVAQIDVSDTSSSIANDSLNNDHIAFDVHVGYGTFAGGRVGVRVFPLVNLSVELSYGYDWANFFPPSDRIDIYNIGINWKSDINDKITYCFNIKYHQYFKSKSGDLAISPSIGIMNFKSSGIVFWCRAGLFTSIYSFDENQFRFYGIGLNLDLGMALNIQY